LRDRALIGLMVYILRIGTALGRMVEEVYTQNAGFGCDCARTAASDT
jgi:hypothetical protein